MVEVAVLGMGRMGAAMTRKLAAAGHDVVVWNRSPAAAEEVARAAGVRVAPDAAAAAGSSDLVISILASGPITLRVLLDPAVLAALRPGAVVCDMGTSGREAAHSLAEDLSAVGARFVDAPVSGSVPTIEAGKLLVMASGDREGVDLAGPVFGAFAKRVAYLGPAGAGQTMKLAVNLIVFTLNSAVSEALTLASTAGIDVSDAYDVFLDSVIAAPLVAYKRAAFLDPEAPVAMSLDLAHKDMELVTGLAAGLGVPAAVAEEVRDEIARACASGFGDRDMAALAHFLDEATAKRSV